MYTVTFGSKKAWRHWFHSRAAAIGRRKMKNCAHKRERRAVRNEIKNGRYDFAFAPFCTSWDVN